MPFIVAIVSVGARDNIVIGWGSVEFQMNLIRYGTYEIISVLD